MLRALTLTLALVLIAAADAPPVAQAPLLWRASKEGRGDLYLLGAIELRRERPSGLDPAIDAAFESADGIAVPVDLGTQDRAALNDRIVELALLDAGTTLRDKVSETTYAEVRLALESLKLPPDSLDAFEPWFTGIFLASRLRALLGYRAEYGLSAHFLERARGAKPIVSLETHEHRVRVRTELPGDLQALMLEKTLQHLDVERLERIEGAWDAGDAELLEALFFEDLRADPRTAPYFERVVFGRNRELARGLESLLEPGTTWFAVIPVGHLVGARSISDLLAARGYAVERIPSRRAAEEQGP
jgi:uncharacterized protein YbaP (TraB family)